MKKILYTGWTLTTSFLEASILGALFILPFVLGAILLTLLK